MEKVQVVTANEPLLSGHKVLFREITIISLFPPFFATFISLQFPVPSPLFSIALRCLYWTYLRRGGTLDLFDIQYFTIHNKLQSKHVLLLNGAPWSCTTFCPCMPTIWQHRKNRMRRRTNYCTKVEAESENVCQVLVSWLKSNWFEFQRHITI